MKHQKMHEFAKFLSGLIFADFIYGLWIYSAGLLPLRWWGMTFAVHTVIAGMIFDVLLFAFLVHYGWFANRRPRTSAEKRFHIVVAVLLIIVAILHFLRIVFGWNFTIGGFNFPYWVNGVGTVITAFLAYASLHLAARK